MTTEPTVDVNYRRFLFDQWADELSQAWQGDECRGRLIRNVERHLFDAQTVLRHFAEGIDGEEETLTDAGIALDRAVEEIDDLRKRLDTFEKVAGAAYNAGYGLEDRRLKEIHESAHTETDPVETK